VLDPPSDTDTELKPKRAAPSGGVGETAQHLSQEDLQAYVRGQLPPARLNYCRTHLDSCVACRAELEDLRSLESEASGFSRPEPPGRELERRRKRRTLRLVQTAAAAIILVAVIFSVSRWFGDRLPAKKSAIATSVTQIVPPPLATAPRSAPVATTQPRDTQPAGPVSAPRATEKPGAATPIQQGNLPPPTDPSQSPEPAPTQTNRGFALLSPLGEAIAESRPEFRWTPLAGAVRYSVAIVDERLHPVEHSRALRTTSWRPRRPLSRGRTYLWQVTATLHGGSTVVASGPSSSGALLRISPK
jgi:anti-sigma factor RsiW